MGPPNPSVAGDCRPFTNMFRTTLRRLAQTAETAAPSTAPRSKLTIANNPYRAKKVWPPNFADLTPQQQLRFEKKYKRRVVQSQYSEKWDRGTKILRFTMVSAALIYALFFAEMEFYGQKYKPADEIVVKVGTIFGVMDPEKRYERRRDAPPINPKSSEPAPKA